MGQQAMPAHQHSRRAILLKWVVTTFLVCAALACLALSWLSKVYVPWPCGIALAICAYVYSRDGAPRDVKLMALSIAWVAQRIAYDFWSQGSVPETIKIGQIIDPLHAVSL